MITARHEMIKEQGMKASDLEIKAVEPMAKDDSIVTPDSSDMSHNRGKVDQRAAKHENKCVLLASSTKN
ncbi:hypothetical protein Tco_0562446 [Tanacetum coccineum]